MSTFVDCGGFDAVAEDGAIVYRLQSPLGLEGDFELSVSELCYYCFNQHLGCFESLRNLQYSNFEFADLLIFIGSGKELGYQFEKFCCSNFFDDPLSKI